jgi:peptidyl-prolyl cis-trans isomerase C
MSNKLKMAGAVSALVIVLGAGAYFIFGNSASVHAENNEAATVAIVNGKEITRKDVNDVVETLPMQQNAPLEKIYPMVVDQLINDMLLETKIEETNIKTDPEVQERLDIAREQILRDIYIERYIKDEVNEATVKEAYKRLKEEGKSTEEVRARHILLESEEEAQKLISELEDGADFVALAKAHSTGPTGPQGGDLGYFTKDAMVPEFAEAAFKAEPGSFIKEPVKTQFGWHVIYVEDKRTQEIPPFDEVKKALRGQLNQRAMNQLVENLRKDAEIQKFTLEGEPAN